MVDYENDPIIIKSKKAPMNAGGIIKNKSIVLIWTLN